MDRQSSTCVIVDVDGAMDTNDLESFLYMIDTQKPMGSTGEGTARLTTVADGDPVHTLNWVALPINTPPRSVPKDVFSSIERDERPLLDVKGGLVDTSLPFFSEPSRKLGGGGPISAGFVSRGRDQVRPNLIHPPPQILSITGEAVARGVMFPALYGSPALEGGGLYWSATVDTRYEGTFFYEMRIKLTRMVGLSECGQRVWESCILPCRSRIRVIRTCVENGFEPRRLRPWGRRRHPRRRAPHFYTVED